MGTLNQFHTYREIVSQSDVWAACLDGLENQIVDLGDWAKRPPPEVIFTGCGSTHYLSISAAAFWRMFTRGSARAVPASELWLLPDSVHPAPGCMLVAVSRSGETSETLHAIEVFRQRTSGEIIAITCYPDSPIITQADRALVVSEAAEESIAQTRSFTSMFLAVMAFASVFAGKPDFFTSLRGLPRGLERLFGKYETLAKGLANKPDIQGYSFLGSGICYGLACEAMLKMKEMTLSPSEAFHTLEFRHGPKSVIGSDTLVVGLLNPVSLEQEAPVLQEMRDLGAPVLAIADSALGVRADYIVETGASRFGLGACLLSLPVLQLMACYRAVYKGLNPDQPRHLDAVVKL